MSEAAVLDPTETTPQVTEANPVTDEQEADALLAEIRGADGTEADKGDGTEGEQSAVDDEEQAAINARAAELAEQKAQELAQEQEAKRKADEEKAARKAESEGIDRDFRGRLQAVEAFLKENRDNLSDEAIQRVLATFSAHHAQAAPVTQRQMQRELAAAAGLEEYEWTDTAAFVQAVKEVSKGEATAGMLSKTQHERQLADALLAQKRRYQKNPELLTAATSTARDIRADPAGGGKLYSELSPDERNAMSPAERDAAVAREAAFRARQGA